MEPTDLIAHLDPPRVEAFFGFFDFEPWEAPEVIDGRAVIDLRGVIGFDVDANDIAPKLRAMTADVLEVHIDSGGGNVWHGVALANALLQHPARVEIEVDAMAASAASVIAMAGDTVTMHPGTMMMVHNGRATVDSATAEDLTALAALLDQINVNMADLYAARAGGTRAGWLETMAGEAWFTGEEAMAAGLATAVVDVARRDGEGAPEASTDLREIFGYTYNGRDDAPAPDLVIGRLTDPEGAVEADTERDPSEFEIDLSVLDTDIEADTGGAVDDLTELASTFAAMFSSNPDHAPAEWAKAILGKADHAYED